jgi:hypothetical protein
MAVDGKALLASIIANGVVGIACLLVFSLLRIVPKIKRFYAPRR